MDIKIDFPLRRERLYEQVANKIKKMIIEESLRPGDKLPSERILAERLGVSRTVIREATRVLNVQGLVDVKPGSGTYIQEISPHDAAAQISLFLKLRQKANSFENLHEIRYALEVDIAGLAAERASDDDIAAMEVIIEKMEGYMENGEQFIQHDLTFHSLLADATQNDLYNVLMAPVIDLLLEFRLIAYHFDTEGSIEGGLTHHRRILELVKTRDVEGARQAMRDHLNQAQDLFIAARKQAGVK